jgi:hypothetical protein
LEALYLGTQPIISDIEVFKEIYKDLPVIYFNGIDDLTKKLQLTPSNINCETEITNRYSFKKFKDIILDQIDKCTH